MARIIEFRLSQRPTSRRSTARVAATGTADILFFSGVRYERLETVKKKAGASAKAAPKKMAKQ